MKVNNLHTLAALVAATLVLASCSTMNSGWMSLDESMSGWHTVGDANWHWEGNEIVADMASGISHLVTDASYGDFQIQAEFWRR